jgi:hypothetical protein
MPLSTVAILPSLWNGWNEVEITPDIAVRDSVARFRVKYDTFTIVHANVYILASCGNFLSLRYHHGRKRADL